MVEKSTSDCNFANVLGWFGRSFLEVEGPGRAKEA